MSTYLMGAIAIHDPEGYVRYREGVGAALAPFEGVEILSIDDEPLMFEGEQPAGHLLLLKFVSSEQLEAFYASDAYQKIVHHRHASSKAVFLMGMRGRDEAPLEK